MGTITNSPGCECCASGATCPICADPPDIDIDKLVITLTGMSEGETREGSDVDFPWVTQTADLTSYDGSYDADNWLDLDEYADLTELCTHTLILDYSPLFTFTTSTSDTETVYLSGTLTYSSELFMGDLYWRVEFDGVLSVSPRGCRADAFGVDYYEDGHVVEFTAARTFLYDDVPLGSHCRLVLETDGTPLVSPSPTTASPGAGMFAQCPYAPWSSGKADPGDRSSWRDALLGVDVEIEVVFV